MNHFTQAPDINTYNNLLKLASEYKLNPFIDKHLGLNKRVGLLFLNPSLRTRLSTQIAASNLGMESIVLNMDKDSWAIEFLDGAIMNGNTIEHIKDAAPILGNYFDILCIRSFPSLKNKIDDSKEVVLNSFIKYAHIPIISLESATLHPLQSLADCLTIQEYMHAFGDTIKNKKPKIVLTWGPHIKAIPHCVANSFAQWMQLENDVDFVITNPRRFNLSNEFTKNTYITHNQVEALENADFVYVKNWSSFDDYGNINSDPSWMLSNEKLKITNNAKLMHCLPVRRNVEMSDEVIDSPNSLIQKQAANRVWAAQAVISTILKNKK
ncbi:MAG: acetylornithine carbamoyltransferase [Sediminibacterium sp.]|nr:acetylornithine carbamoyltransferase [Sediminibacterium sp.]